MIKRVARFAGVAAIILAGLYFTFSHSRLKSGSAATAPEVAGARTGPVALSPTERSGLAGTNSAPSAVQQPQSRESDPGLNPYAAALREPGKSKRAWDLDFLKRRQKVSGGEKIDFELTEGRMASGTIQTTQFREGELVYLSGELIQPEKGKFFFLTPPLAGKAGKAVGVVEFPASGTAYCIEPTGCDNYGHHPGLANDGLNAEGAQPIGVSGVIKSACLGRKNSERSNRRMRKTARTVVWEGAGAQSPAPDPINQSTTHRASSKWFPYRSAI